MKLLIIFLSLYIVHCSAYCTGAECNAKASRLSTTGNFLKGDEVYVRVRVTNGTTTIYGTFFPVVDEFSRMELFSSVLDSRFCKDISTNVTVEVHAQSKIIESEARQYTSDTAFAPYFGVIISIKEGDITGVRWDDNCDGCTGDEQECIAGKTCGTKYGSDDSLNSCQSRETDIKIYVSWLGYDSRGEYMTSAGQALSRLRQFAVYPVTASAGRNAKAKLEKKI